MSEQHLPGTTLFGCPEEAAATASLAEIILDYQRWVEQSTLRNAAGKTAELVLSAESCMQVLQRPFRQMPAVSSS